MTENVNKKNQKYLYNISWQLSEKIVRILSSLIIGLWLAKYLGEESYGLFSYALTIVLLIAPISSLGLDPIMIKYLGAGQRVYIGTALSLKLSFSTIVVLAFYLNYVENTALNDLLKTMGFVIFFLSFSTIEALYTATLKAKYNSLAIFVAISASAILKIFLIVNEYPLWYFAVAHLLEVTLQYGIIASLYFVTAKNEGKFFSCSVAKELLSQSWPVMLSGLFVVVYMKVDQLMIMNLLGAAPLGEYSLAVKLVESLIFIAVAINSTLYPLILKSKTLKNRVYENRLVFIFKIQILIAVIISVIFLLFANYFFALILPGQYAKTAQILIIYSWSNIFVFLNNSSWLWFLTENLQKYAMIRLLAGALINVVLNYGLIPAFGLVGAAYSTLISYFIAVYLINAFHPKTMPLFIMQTKAFVDFAKIWKYSNVKNS